MSKCFRLSVFVTLLTANNLFACDEDQFQVNGPQQVAAPQTSTQHRGSSNYQVIFNEQINSPPEYIHIRTSTGKFYDLPVINGLMPQINERLGLVTYHNRIPFGPYNRSIYASQGYFQYNKPNRITTNYQQYPQSQFNNNYANRPRPMNAQDLYAEDNGDPQTVEKPKQIPTPKPKAKVKVKVPAPVSDEPTTASPSETEPTEGLTNVNCPMTGEEASPEFKLTIDGKTTYFCCEDCLKAAKESLDSAVAAWTKE